MKQAVRVKRDVCPGYLKAISRSLVPFAAPVLDPVDLVDIAGCTASGRTLIDQFTMHGELLVDNVDRESAVYLN